MPYFFFFAIYVDIHVIFSASIRSKRHTSFKFSSNKSALNKKTKLSVWPSFVMYVVYTVILVCVYLPNKSQVQDPKYYAKG